MGELKKTCTKHGALKPEDIYKAMGSQYLAGYTLRCRRCIFEKRMRGLAKTCKKHGVLKLEDVKGDGRCSICHRATANTKRNTDQEAKAARNVREKLKRDEDPQKYRDIISRYRATLPKGHRIRDVLTLRGLSWEQYEQLKKDHNDKCAICGMPETRLCSKNKGQTLRLAIDHCHLSGAVRGLLCHNCNTGIGKFKENVEVMFNAINYIEYWEFKK